MVADKLAILFLAANPVDTDQLQLDKEISSIDDVLQQSEYRDRFQLIPAFAVSYGDLQARLLRNKPHIVHFSGHGSTAGEIVLMGEGNRSQRVPPHALAELFSILKDNVRCVVLNACYSKIQAYGIAQHVDCVVGMSRAIADDAAIDFASGFYLGLGFGRSVQTAFDLGCNRIGLAGKGVVHRDVLLVSSPADYVAATDTADDSAVPQLISLRLDPTNTVLIDTAVEPVQPTIISVPNGEEDKNRMPAGPAVPSGNSTARKEPSPLSRASLSVTIANIIGMIALVIVGIYIWSRFNGRSFPPVAPSVTQPAEMPSREAPLASTPTTEGVQSVASPQVTTFPYIPRLAIVPGGDFNGDGKTDIFAICPSNGQWLLFSATTKNDAPLNNVSLLYHDLSRTISDLHFGDFNGDGRTDVFTTNSNGQWLMSSGGKDEYVMLNVGVTDPISDVRFGDFNGDGKTDVFRTTGQTWQVSLSGKSEWQPWETSAVSIHDLSFDDFDGDGKTDVFRATGSEWVIALAGRQPWRKLNTSTLRLDNLAFGDFDGDGSADVFRTTGREWHVSSGGNSKWQAWNTSMLRLDALAFGDFDGDGKSDVFTTNPNGQWLMYSGSKGDAISLHQEPNATASRLCVPAVESPTSTLPVQPTSTIESALYDVWRNEWFFTLLKQ